MTLNNPQRLISHKTHQTKQIKMIAIKFFYNQKS